MQPPAAFFQSYEIKTLQEARVLASHLAGFYPKPLEFRAGINELLVNAIEHGNLEIGHLLKEALLREDAWETEINLRLSSPIYTGKQIFVSLIGSEKHLILTVRDEGKGFLWKKYSSLPPTSSLSGRGIPIIQNCGFDSVTYHGCGNNVTCILKVSDILCNT